MYRSKFSQISGMGYIWQLLFVLSLLIPASLSIACYECDSSNHFSCTEFWDPELPVNQQVGL
jgi:hypothetical protein